MNADDQNTLEGRLEIGQRLEALSRQAQPLARIVDQAPRDSSQWTEAAKEHRDALQLRPGQRGTETQSR